MKITRPYALLFFGLCLQVQLLWAQSGRLIPGNPGLSETPSGELLNDFLGDDTLNVKYFFADNPGIEFAFKDTLMDYFQQYDPTRTSKVDYGHLGNLGSAHQPLQYQTPFRLGLDLGLHQFDLYRFESSSLPFYRLTKAFTNLYFTQGTQTESLFRGQFSRNFENGLNYSLNYHRYNNLGAFRSQRARNTAFVTGFWYNSPKGKYDAYITYVYNEIRQRDNGGIRLDALTNENIVDEFSIPVFLDRGAETRYAYREFSLLQTYNLSGKPDSVRSSSDRSFFLRHQLKFLPSEYKFFDDNPDDDNGFYKELNLDTRGLRYFFKLNTFSNTFRIATAKSRQENTEDLKKQKDLLEVALHHKIHFLKQEPRDTVLNDLYLSGRWLFSPSDRLSVSTYAHLALWNQAGDYRLEGALSFDLPKIGSLTAQAITQAYAPSVIAFRHFVTQQQAWKNNFNKTFENSIQGQLKIPKLGLRASVQYNLITNLIYYDTSSIARQAGNSINILQFRIAHQLKWKALRFDNELILQEISGEVLRMPPLFSKHSLFVEFKIFRKILNVQAGMDLRFNTVYRPQAYQPLTGQFHLQESLEAVAYPAFDAFFNFKVRRLRFFIKMENITEYIRSDFFYQTAFSPNPYATMRMGLSWQLLD
ncbi:MAG: putative porin [Bacteroidota bacterium]